MRQGRHFDVGPVSLSWQYGKVFQKTYALMHMHFVEWLRLIFCFLILILMPSFRLTFFISIVSFEPQIFVCVYIDYVYFLSFLPPILFGLI